MEGLFAASLIVGALFAAIIIGTTVALILWIVVAVVLAAVVIRVTFRRHIRNSPSGDSPVRD
jgi:membrane protein implicated in regulation of membrane protease activity